MKIIAVLFLFVLSLYAIDLNSTLQTMDRRGLDVYQFQDKEEGKVIVATETIQITGKNGLDDVLAAAVAHCEEKIIGLQKGRSYSGEQTLNMVDDSLEVKQNHRESVRGEKLHIDLYSYHRDGNTLHVVCYTSDNLNKKFISPSSKLKKEPTNDTRGHTNNTRGHTNDNSEYDEIKVTGVASLEGGRQNVRDLALNKARQEAIKRVLGTTLAGSTTVKEISQKNVDETGKENFTSDEHARSKLYTSAMGFAEIIKVFEEGEQDGLYKVTVLARVYKNRLEEDYSPALKQLGNPGFFVEANDAQSAIAKTFFMTCLHDWGFRMSPTSYDADYTFRVKVKFIPKEGKDIPSITLTMIQKSTGDSLITVQNDLTSFAIINSADAEMETKIIQAAEEMEFIFHRKINDAIGRMNASGRRFTIRLEGTTQFNRKEVDAIQEIIDNLGAIDNINVESNPIAQVTDFMFEYSGDSHDLSRMLEKAFQESIKKKKNRPKLKGLEKNRIIFYF